jgi:hypothetical protein
LHPIHFIVEIMKWPFATIPQERKRGTAMAQTASVDRVRIAAEFVKGMEAERALGAIAKARAEAPPDPALGVLYHEIAEADERHAMILETIATRFGHTPSRSAGGGVGRAWEQLKDKFGKLNSSALDQLSWDLTAKAQSAQWHTAWVHTFGAIAEVESARELSVVLAEEQAHLDALQQGLNRMVEQHARGADKVK